MVQLTARQAMSGRQAAASPGKEFGDGPTRRSVAMMAPVVPARGRLEGEPCDAPRTIGQVEANTAASRGPEAATFVRALAAPRARRVGA
jgi:hypothetical protein